MADLTEKQLDYVADAIASVDMHEDEYSDNVAILIVSAFEDDPSKPEDQEEDPDLHWTPWALEKEKSLRRRMALAAIAAYEKVLARGN